MPRLKGISRQKLCKAEAGQNFLNLDQIIIASRPINSQLIEEYLNAVVKACSSTKIGYGGCGELPSSLHTKQYPTPYVQSLR